MEIAKNLLEREQELYLSHKNINLLYHFDQLIAECIFSDITQNYVLSIHDILQRNTIII